MTQWLVYAEAADQIHSFTTTNQYKPDSELREAPKADGLEHDGSL